MLVGLKYESERPFYLSVFGTFHADILCTRYEQ